MRYLEQTSALEIKDTRISFSESGAGEPILLLHGNPGSRKDFSLLCELMASDTVKCVFPDRPGHMSSEEIIYDSPDHWLETDIFAEFIDKQCSGKTWLAGYSMGSFIAAKIALKFPEKVKGIIMLSPYVIPDNASEKPSSIPDLAKGALIGTFFGVVMPLLTQNKMTEHLKNVFHPVRTPQEYLETWLPRYTRFESLMAMMSDKNSMLAIMNEVHARLSEIKCPIEIIAGCQDRVCSNQNQIRLMQEKLPDTKAHMIDDGGHGLPLTHPEICAELILKALKKAS